jgi:hypothetical protein
MGKINDLLNLRFKQKENNETKTTALAELSQKGNLSGFSGVFRVSGLNNGEKDILLKILQNFHGENSNIEKDFQSLSTITSEVKAISNQAVILHGERIKKAQEILKEYKEGAFSAWLIATYGNRQTPYNFLQYYEFYNSMPTTLHSKMEVMPRQAIYTLASRDGEQAKKEEIINNYNTQPKQVLLSIIRKAFPLQEKDKRQEDVAEQVITSLKRLKYLLGLPRFKPTAKQLHTINELIAEMNVLAEKK